MMVTDRGLVTCSHHRPREDGGACDDEQSERKDLLMPSLLPCDGSWRQRDGNCEGTRWIDTPSLGPLCWGIVHCAVELQRHCCSTMKSDPVART